jgi:glycosyltransferase involved in cell wall biosynthesis
LNVPLSIVILTFNEERNLPDCLASLQGLGEIVVVDSGSTDQTLVIAESYGAHIFRHPFGTHAKQWDWALKQLPLNTDWILAVDADQRLTPELKKEIPDALNGSKMNGYFINRRQIFRGKWIKHGGYYPKYLLKLFRKAAVHTSHQDLVDHHFLVDGRCAKLKYDLVEDNQKESELFFWIQKHGQYANLQAQQEWNGKGSRNGRIFGNPDEQTNVMKRIWFGLPHFVRPFLYFFYRYFIRLGFLDGKEGFLFHTYQAFWYRMLIDLRLGEFRHGQMSVLNESMLEIETGQNDTTLERLKL